MVHVESAAQRIPPRRRARDIPASPALWAFIGSLALAAVFMRATVLHLHTGIVGGRYDGYENVWNDDWLRTALLHLHQTPFFSNWIEYPSGTSLRVHTLNPLGGILALPVAPLIGEIAAFNLKLLFSLVLCTFFAWLLIRDLVGKPLASFAGAAVCTYANDQVIHNTLTGTENYLMGAALLPLYCFVLLRAATRPRWGGYAVAAVGTLLGLSLVDRCARHTSGTSARRRTSWRRWNPDSCTTGARCSPSTRMRGWTVGERL